MRTVKEEMSFLCEQVERWCFIKKDEKDSLIGDALTPS